MSFPRPVIYPDLTQFLYVTVVLNNDPIHASFIYHKLWSRPHNLSPQTNVCIRQSSEPQSLSSHLSTNLWNLCCFTPALAHQWCPRQDSLLASHVCPHWPLVLVLKLTKEDPKSCSDCLVVSCWIWVFCLQLVGSSKGQVSYNPAILPNLES